MKLNDAKDIRLGAVPVQRICLRGQTIWEHSAPGPEVQTVPLRTKGGGLFLTKNGAFLSAKRRTDNG